jgi:hypothetical protein
MLFQVFYTTGHGEIRVYGTGFPTRKEAAASVEFLRARGENAWLGKVAIH